MSVALPPKKAVQGVLGVGHVHGPGFHTLLAWKVDAAEQLLRTPPELLTNGFEVIWGPGWGGQAGGKRYFSTETKHRFVRTAGQCGQKLRPRAPRGQTELSRPCGAGTADLYGKRGREMSSVNSPSKQSMSCLSSSFVVAPVPLCLATTHATT